MFSEASSFNQPIVWTLNVNDNINMNSIVSLSGLSGLLLQEKTAEQFNDVAAISGTALAVIIIVIVILSILFLVTVYKMVPSHSTIEYLHMLH